MKRITLLSILVILTGVPGFAMSPEELIRSYDLIAENPIVKETTSPHRYKIFEEYEKYYVISRDARAGKIEIILDPGNGYLRIWDTHEGACEWGFNIEFAIFTSKSNNIYLVYTCTNYRCDNRTTLAVFRKNKNLNTIENVTDSVFPKISFDNLKNVDSNVIREMRQRFNVLNFCYELPRYGTIITCIVDLSTYKVLLDYSDYEDQNTIHRMRKNVEKMEQTVLNRIDLRWDVDREKFYVVKHYRGPWHKLVIRNE